MRLRRVAADWLYAEPFWYELERHGHRVIAVDVPMSFPPRLAQGVEVTNWGAHDQLGPLACYPRAVEPEIRRRFGTHPMGYEIPVDKSHRELRRIRDHLVAGARRKAELSRWLLDSRPWDFFITVLAETHRGGHLLWPVLSSEGTVPSTALLDVYRAVDQAIGDILACLPLSETTVMIFSLHGMGPNTSQEHFVPQLMDLVNARFTGVQRDPRVPGRLPRRRALTRLLRESVPAQWQNTIAQAVPVSVRDMVVNRSIVGGHDWQRTPGLDLLADLNGYLRFNIRGREGQGALEPGSDALARYVESIRECFQSFRLAGSRERLVRAVRLTSDELSGRRVEQLPDMVATWTDIQPALRIDSEAFGSLTVTLATGRPGNHRPDGFCVVLGPGSQQAGEMPAGDIRDLSQTVLRTLLTT